MDHPIIFSAPMVLALLAGKKSQTRRVMKNQPDAVVRIYDEEIRIDYGIGGNHKLWRTAQINPRVAQLRLYGGARWTNLLANEVQRLWQEGVRGLVSARRPQEQEGLLECMFVPQQCEGEQERPSAGMQCISRTSTTSNLSGAAPRRKPNKQCTDEPALGDATRKLDGPQTSCEASESPALQIHDGGEGAHPLGGTQGASQPAPCGPDTRLHPILHLGNCPFEVGRRLWVKETWHHALPIGVPEVTDEYKSPLYIDYRADLAKQIQPLWKWKSPMFMPKWASRVTLEISDVWVQQLQGISAEDALAEGISESDYWKPKEVDGKPFEEKWWDDYEFWTRYPQIAYRKLWESINGAGSWDRNPWVWAISFRMV